MSSRMEFKSIAFGTADANTEKAKNPRLLIEGFLDAKEYISSIMNRDKFLVLGPKGSGKTAIASKLDLLSKETEDLLVKQYYSHGDFPFSSFSRLLPSKEAPQTRYHNYWEFLFLTTFLESSLLIGDANLKMLMIIAFI